MIPRTPGGLRRDVKAQLREVERINEGVNDAHRILGIDRLIQTLGK